jgi:pimeloyl-ACP methyl ester carboxylesterase
MKSSFSMIALLSMAVLSSFSQTKTGTFVIVHGAWSDASYWKSVVTQLKADGHEVITVNLPGHGKDNTAIASISLQLYVDAVIKAIDSKTNITLVGHSFAGIVISQVAEKIPAQIKELLYIGAYVPKNGESLLTIANTDADSHAGKNLRPDEKAGVAGIVKENIIDVFAADASPSMAEYMVANFKPEPLAPLATPVTLTDGNFGQLKKVYVHTLNDHVIGYALQQSMVKNAGILRTYALPSSHTPFQSMPLVVAAIINHEAKSAR